MFAATSVAVCAAAALCSTGPAPAPAAAPGETPDTALTLSLSDNRGQVTSVELTCQPVRGSHPKAEEACGALEQAAGDFAALPVKNQACTMVYSPVLARAHGHWRGEIVEFTTEYSNRCVADARSGGVFAF